MQKKINLTGQVFGRLKVLREDTERGQKEKIREREGKIKRSSVFWFCQCECGEIKSIRASDLKSGNIVSCGCYLKERRKLTTKKSNVYDLTGEYGIGYPINNKNGKFNKFYFDLEDYDKIKEFCWCINKRGYVSAKDIRINSKKRIRLHRLITNNKWKIVDHINRKPWDCRKINLRKATFQENLYNKNLYKNSSSGITGVNFRKQSNKWLACIQINHKLYRLGLFENKNDAIIARLKAEKEMLKEFAPQKELFEQYGIE